jgi:acyl dehydratase
MDADAGRDAGYPGAIGMGFLQWSYVHNMLRAFVGKEGRIVRVACRFRSPALAGAVVSTGGTVTGIATIDGEMRVELEVWTRNQDGDDLSPGTATVAFPA